MLCGGGVVVAWWRGSVSPRRGGGIGPGVSGGARCRQIWPGVAWRLFRRQRPSALATLWMGDVIVVRSWCCVYTYGRGGGGGGGLLIMDDVVASLRDGTPALQVEEEDTAARWRGRWGQVADNPSSSPWLLGVMGHPLVLWPPACW